MKNQNEKNKKELGSILLLVLVFAAVFTTIGTGLVGMVSTQHKLSSQKVASRQALHIAEAGINYYRWHLAHSPNDFQDGTGGSGPYVHDYKDPEGTVIGKFSLEIIAPSGCESAVKIQSTGWTLSHPQTKRIVQVRYGKQALAKYAFLTKGCLVRRRRRIKRRISFQWRNQNGRNAKFNSSFGKRKLFLRFDTRMFIF